MTLTESDKRTMASYMRTILRSQCRSPMMDSRLTVEIKEAGLLKEVLWPAYHVVLTERGREFLAEVEGDE
jgi:hypothetical protein